MSRGGKSIVGHRVHEQNKGQEGKNKLGDMEKKAKRVVCADKQEEL